MIEKQLGVDASITVNKNGGNLSMDGHELVKIHVDFDLEANWVWGTDAEDKLYADKISMDYKLCQKNVTGKLRKY